MLPGPGSKGVGASAQAVCWKNLDRQTGSITMMIGSAKGTLNVGPETDPRERAQALKGVWAGVRCTWNC